MLWGKFHTVRLLLAPWGRGLHTCVCVCMHVRVSNGQLLGHTGRLRMQTLGLDVLCWNLDASTDWCGTPGKFPFLSGPRFPHL